MVVKWSKYAIDDLKNCVQNSKIYATGKLEKYINNLVLYVNDLQTSPLLGKEFYTYKEIEIRQLLYKMHRIFYYIYDDSIIIIMVTHTSRDLTNIIKAIKRIL